MYSGQILPAGKEYGNSSTFYKNYLGKADYQPRIGLAWTPSQFQGKLVARAGYTVSTFWEGGGAGEQPTQNPPYTPANSSAGAGTLSAPFGTVVSNCPTIQVSCYTNTDIFLLDPNFMPELTQQWNVTLQYQLNNSTTLQIGYVGQKSSHLLNLMDYSQYQLTAPGVAVPGPYLAGNPALKAAFTPTSGLLARGGDSNGNAAYNALQAVLQKKMADGLQAQVAYTYSKCMSDSGGFYGSWGGQASPGVIGWQNVYDRKADWGPCFFDTTQMLTAYAVYELPFGKGRKYGNNMNSIVNGVIGGWNLSPIVSWHSGYALTMANGWWDQSGTGGLGALYENERPNCTGPVQYLKTKDPVAGIDWFSPNSFAGALSGTFGNCSVGDVRGPGYFDVDLGIHKDFPIREGMRFELRGELMNLFNNVIYNAPSNGCGNYSGSGGCASTLGLITGSQGARNAQIALKLYF